MQVPYSANSRWSLWISFHEKVCLLLMCSICNWALVNILLHFKYLQHSEIYDASCIVSFTCSHKHHRNPTGFWKQTLICSSPYLRTSGQGWPCLTLLLSSDLCVLWDSRSSGRGQSCAGVCQPSQSRHMSHLRTCHWPQQVPWSRQRSGKLSMVKKCIFLILPIEK